jgi:hypothetical protein
LTIKRITGMGAALIACAMGAAFSPLPAHAAQQWIKCTPARETRIDAFGGAATSAASGWAPAVYAIDDAKGILYAYHAGTQTAHRIGGRYNLDKSQILIGDNANESIIDRQTGAYTVVLSSALKIEGTCVAIGPPPLAQPNS